MATLVLSTVGTALGGPIGGAIGALAGRQLDGALFGPAARNGPRLRELEVSLSSYGTAMPRVHGRMRVAGAIIWATELQEHSETRGTGKGQPALTTYSYTANLAVALSSRPIAGVGRIWADGKLLRGIAGDLKTGGVLRIYPGSEAQAIDPLIAASEGPSRCPAFRGLAHVVLEALDLTDFGNRIPALTFEVIADQDVSLHALLGETLPDVTVRNALPAMTGFVIEDSLGASLAALAPAVPIVLDAAGDSIVACVTDNTAAAIMLGDAAISAEDDAFAPAQGSSSQRASAAPQPPRVLRYFDVTRDFQPGSQHASGRAGAGQPDIVELPAALDPATGRSLVEQMARRQDGALDRIAWRSATLDPAIGPGTIVRLPDRAGSWQVESWEWREAGVELELSRVRPALQPACAPAQPDGSPPFSAPTDLPAAETRLVVCELPWDAGQDARDTPRIAAIVSASGPPWSGAALYADHGDGQLWPLGPASRTRGVTGTALDAIGPASPLLFDRGGVLTVRLAASDLALTSATLADLAAGANLALIGEELVQFASVERLGESLWRVSGLLRGRGGTEAAIGGHVAQEAFALIDPRLTLLAGNAGLAADVATIVAQGLGDAEPVSARVHLAGIGSRPLSPVHPRVAALADGTLRLAWTRRARGGWEWRDGVDVPLAEESERYLVTYEAGGATVQAWLVTSQTLFLEAGELARLADIGPDAGFMVRQQGTHGLSLPLPLPLPPPFSAD